MADTSSLSGDVYDLIFGNKAPYKWDSLPEYINYFNAELMQFFNPDINGYTMAFMVPPPFKSIDKKQQEYFDHFQKLVCFSAVQFSPPQREVQSERTSARTGGVPYATEMAPSQQCNVSYIDNYNLDVYNFHNAWVQCIHDMIEGFIEPASEYLDYNDERYGGLDYAGSLFVIRLDHSLSNIKYLGKVTGIFPQSLPSKELLGQRSANELTTLPFNYYCAYYEESLHSETESHPIWDDFKKVIEIYKG